MALLTAALVGALAWGVLAFGGVYPWAYLPLLVALAIVGVAGLWVARATRRSVNVVLLSGLLAVAAAAGAQLVPLPAATLAAVSPSTDTFLTRYDIVYAFRRGTPAAPAGEATLIPPTHPLSVDPPATRRALLFLVSLGTLLIGVTAALSSGRLDVLGLARGLIGLGAFVALVGIVEHASFRGLIYGFWRPQFTGAVFGPFVNRNHFAAWMIMAAPLAIAYLCGIVDARRARRPRRGPAVLLWLASAEANPVALVSLAIVLMVAATLFTASRSGIACLTATLLVFGWAAARGTEVSPSRRLLARCLVLLPLPLVAWVGIGPALGRFAELHDAGLTGRLALWQDTLRVIADFPLTGTGLNTYGASMLFYKTTDPLYHYYAAHNEYLQLAADGGLLVTVPASVLLALFAREVWRRFRAGRDPKRVYWLRLGAVAGIIAIAVQSAVEYSLQIPANAALFVVLCAVAAHRSGGSEAAPASVRAAAPPAPRPTPLRLAVDKRQPR